MGGDLVRVGGDLVLVGGDLVRVGGDLDLERSDLRIFLTGNIEDEPSSAERCFRFFFSCFLFSFFSPVTFWS